VSHDVDWDRYLVDAAKKGSPLGDPTRWGALTRQEIPQTLAAQNLQSDQVLQVACTDRYARQWTIAGNLEASTVFWDAPPQGLGSANVGTWFSILRVRMGVANNTILHNIDLRAIIEAQAPFYRDGSFGGESLAPGPTRVRPFVIDAAIVANNISIQIVNVFIYTVLPAAPLFFQTALQINPLAPGGGV
jgi:hypothetical protein